MLFYWPFNEAGGAYRNYGSSGYGAEVQKSGAKYTFSPIVLNSGFYISFESLSASGEFYSQGDVSIGLVGVNGKSVPYLRSGPYFYKPDNKFASNNFSRWAVELKKEDFAAKDYTISFYDKDVNIYTNGADLIKLNGPIIFKKTNGLSEIKLYSQRPDTPIFNPENLVKLFGSSSGTVGSGFSLYMGGNAGTSASGINISLNAFDTCYLLDESGFILLDESGNYLSAEGCGSSFGALFGGFDMNINGEALTSVFMPLYLQQGDTTVGINSGFPLYMLSTNYVTPLSVNLFIGNYYSGVGSGVNLYIEAPGDNDGYTPIYSGIPLYLHRAENQLGQMDMFISGGTTSLSGSVNLTLQATKTALSGSINLSVPYVKSFASSGLALYSMGW